MEKMTIEKAMEIMKSRSKDLVDLKSLFIGEAQGFIDGWESRQAEIDDLKRELLLLKLRDSVSIGRFEISKTNNRLWIYDKSGEGMEVKEEVLERVLKEFYTENF